MLWIEKEENKDIALLDTASVVDFINDFIKELYRRDVIIYDADNLYLTRLEYDEDNRSVDTVLDTKRGGLRELVLNG